MANHKDAIKRYKQSEKARAANRTYRTRMRNQIKRMREALASGNKAEATSQLSVTTSVIQSICGKGVIHRNQAARRISRLHAALKALG